ncbi:hypothetical protein F0726_02977 [Acidithiobacillus caldus]|nr:hypothetical protein F0726_02977 [Acidithiobacillus caldus]
MSFDPHYNYELILICSNKNQWMSGWTEAQCQK